MTKLPTAQSRSAKTPRHWKVHVETLQKSGKSRAEYCRQYKLSYHALAYWQRKLSDQKTSTETTLVPVPFQSFIKQHSAVPDRAALKIILPDKTAIEVGDDFSSATLTRLLATLERR
jgi:hypothetical protein